MSVKRPLSLLSLPPRKRLRAQKRFTVNVQTVARTTRFKIQVQRYFARIGHLQEKWRLDGTTQSVTNLKRVTRSWRLYSRYVKHEEEKVKGVNWLCCLRRHGASAHTQLYNNKDAVNHILGMFTAAPLLY
tara:strand:- start:18 stop:407 length:390 start_codon:yes stop_codon:yes gene_type:complete